MLWCFVKSENKNAEIEYKLLISYDFQNNSIIIF